MPLVLLKSDPRARLKPCLRCGYGLRNITDARNCPECGLAIRLSLSGDDALDVSKPEWVRGQAVGLVVAAVPHLVFLAFVLVTLGQSLGESERLIWFVWAYVYTAAPQVSVMLGLLLLVHHGALLLMARLEGRVPDPAPSMRWTLRVLGYAGIVAAVVLVGLGASARRGPPLTLLVVFALATDVVIWNQVRELARRLPNRRLGWFAEMILWVAVVAAGFAVLQGAQRLIIALVFPFRFRGLGPLWALFLVLYPALSTALLLRIAHAVRGAAVAGEANWVSDPEFR